MRKNLHVLWAPLLVACLSGLGPEALAQPSLLDPTVTQIAAGAFHTCALTTGGGVKCWGGNGAAGLGDGTYTDRPNPVDVAGLSGGVAYIAAGQLHTCALTTSGGVKCWGYNGHGQLGDGTKMNRTTAVDVGGLTSGVASIAAGSTHTCALTTAGGVKCWGYNGTGWLGDGTTDERLTPVDVQGLTSGVLRLAVGVSHSCVVTTAGGVKCWGANNFSQVGDATSTDRLTPTAVWGLTSGVAEISAGAFHTCALSSSGGATCWGHNGYGQVGDGTVTYSRLVPTSVPGLTSGVAGISTGEDHTCAVTIEGGVKCWGYNGYGQLGDGTMVDKPAPTDVVGLGTGVAGVSARGYHSCALTATGEVKCWGANGHGEVGNGLTSPSQTTAVSVAGLSGVAAGVAAGETHGCAVSEGGGARCWGRNDYGQLGDGTATTRLVPTAVTGLGVGVARVATGNYHSCALTRTGGVKCWGYNANGQLGDGTPFMRFEPVGVIGLASGVSDVVAGAVHTCALTTAGGVKCWGENSEGWLGNGTTTGGRTPVDVTGLSSGVVSISARGAHTCALTAAGGVKCWGANNAGQLGDGSTITRSTPADVPGLTSGVAGIAAGGEHSCALLTSGEIKCWGSDVQGQLGDGSYLVSQPTPVQVPGAVEMTRVAAGDFHTCATTGAGAPKCWGYNGSGGLGNGSTAGSAVPVDVLGLSAGVTDLALGNGHTCALTQQGALFCWGENADGLLGDGTTVDRSTPGQVKAGQTITFTGPASLPFGVATALTATSSSGLAVSFDTWTPDTCSIQGDVVTPTDTALCGIRASQPGDGGHAAARQVLSLVIVTTGTVPGPPTVGLALAGDSAVTVAFTPPSSDGGSPITGYTATCGAASGSVGASPVLVPGLQNGVAVTCTVVATNASGDSAPSAPSNSVTPSEGSNVTLTLNLDGIGSGEVAAGASVCNNGAGGPQSCSFSYTPGAVVSLVAYGSPGSGFGAWTGACAHRGNAPTCDVTMTGDVVVGASYLGPQTLTIEVQSSENGVGQAYVSTNGGINLLCDGVAGTTVTCTAQVPIGDTVYFSAFPGNLSVLDSIVGCTADPFDPNGSGCYPGFVMTGPKAVAATFRGPQTLTIQAVSLENGVGWVYANSTGGMNLQCEGVAGSTATCTAQVRVGDTVYFSAFPGNLSVLDSIAGCTADPLDPNGAGCYPGFVMTGPKAAAATFRGPQTLTIQAVSLENGVGGVYANSTGGMNLQCEGVAGSTATCTAQVRVGDTVYFSAFPGSLSVLDTIAGCTVDLLDPNGSGCYPGFVMTGPKAVAATFRGPQTLTIQTVSLENGAGQAYANSAGGMNLQCDGAADTTATCAAQVRAGDIVYFAAFPGNLSVLDSIAGCLVDPIDPNGSGCSAFVMTGPKILAATFRGPQVLTVGFSGAGSGDVGLPSTGVCASSQGICAFSLKAGSAQQLVATPSANSLFQSWTGACAGQGATCSLTVMDDAATQVVFGLRNRAPIAVAGGPYSGVRHQAVGFTGGGSSDPDNDGLTYSWDFGDGSPAGAGVAPTHAYATVGTFTVTLTVSDGALNSVPATSTITISNQTPTASTGGPYSGVRNTAITFDGAGSNDPDSDPLTYSWDFGDDSAAGTGAAPTHAYATTGAFTVTLTVNDGTANSAPATSTVTISDRAPIARPGGPYSGTRLAAIAFNGAASSDPDGDALSYAWAFGDGGTGTGAAPTHLYTAVGTFTATLTVNDGTVSSTPVTTTVQITNVAPTVSITAPSGGAVFHAPASVLVSAAAADLDGSVARVEFFAGGGKIGEAFGAPYSVMWSGASPGVYALTAVVTDSSGATATSAPVSVLLNAPPVVALTAPADNAQFAAPASIMLTASASDFDGTIAQVQFFRGSVSLGVDTTSPYSVTWSGAASGAYTLTAVASDNRGAVVASAPVTVRVTATLTPTADSYVRASNANSNFGSGTTLTVQQGNSNSNIRWTYMKFDLTSVPSITTAKVRLFGAVSATTSTTIQTAVYSVSSTTWTETGLTWNNRPASGTTALGTATIVNNSNTARWYELDVTAYLQAEKAAGRNVVTLALKNLANSTPYVSFTSREGTAANRPQVLVVP